jgi:hypothetical protein
MTFGTHKVCSFHRQGVWYVQGDREAAMPIAHLCCCERDHTSVLKTSLMTVAFEEEAVGKVCFHSLQACKQEGFLDCTLPETESCSLECLTERFHTVVALEEVFLTVVDYKTAVAVAESEAADTGSVAAVDADVEAGVDERLAIEAGAVEVGVELQTALLAVEDAGTGAEADAGVVQLAVDQSDV